MSNKIERDFVAANLATAESLLSRATKRDIVARDTLESWVGELRAELETMTVDTRALASASFYFGGKPVIANRGIESRFAGAIIEQYQNIVSKLSGLRQKDGALGERGVVPGIEESTLHVTNVLRGSFGFQFDEVPDQLPLPDKLGSTPLKDVVDESAALLAALDFIDERQYEDLVKEIDARVFGAIKTFFDTLRAHRAAFRMVCGEIDKQYSVEAIQHTAAILETTQVTESVESIKGLLWGTLPDSRRFEFIPEAGQLIKGPIAKDVPEESVLAWGDVERKIPVLASIRRTRVMRQETLRREGFTLLGISETGSVEIGQNA